MQNSSLLVLIKCWDIVWCYQRNTKNWLVSKYFLRLTENEDQWLLHSHCSHSRSYWATRGSTFHFELIDLWSVSNTKYCIYYCLVPSTQSGLSGLQGRIKIVSLINCLYHNCFSFNQNVFNTEWTPIRGNMNIFFYEKKIPKWWSLYIFIF